MNTMMRRNDLRPLDLMDELDSFRRMRSLLPLASEGVTSPKAFTPMVDIWEEKDRLVFKADLPGFRQEDVTLAVDGNVLRLSGRRFAEKMDDDAVIHFAQRSYGSFTMSWTLPFHVQAEIVMAELKNGELSVVIPRGAASTERVIPLEDRTRVRALG